MAASARCAQAVLVQRDEPLLGGAEERRVLAPPAVRIRVARTAPAASSAPARAQHGSMMRGLASHTVMPGEVLHLGDEAPVVVHRVVDLEPGLAPELVVLLAVAGRDVHEPGARVHGHEVGGEHRHVAVDPRVLADVPSRSRPDEGERRRRRAAAHGLELAAKASTSGRATISTSPSRSTRGVASPSGCTAIARLAGSVHGVVVQMTQMRGPAAERRGERGRGGRSPGSARRPRACVWSSYSTSAWASAVLQCMHQWTGFRPL